ncbi:MULTISPECIES: DUF1573 domain-containing protein [unclassified Lentimonas]|uniref:Ig-like domain-containing protein n=1 Tax=unclassified Lentimonas TaxID=2630993 RepID=UPI001327099B|nr:MULTISPECIES: DUF1573 domain-containing protein [unclassified Lentimonas]CAA6679984.1 Unannotated [Lentimonas sp. CC4]CAA6686540.1 Unannotated [Lentimonas sp. CC6]CAA7074816.1 Unannotated [Lentimonas sp. CC4]CAA7169443.1 Unannotated [Lentimonas sp. CC21]CAA7180166.1 Unannotated [Lentimonas sp. CC8]
MNKFLSRLSALTLLLIAAFAIALLLKNRSAMQPGSALSDSPENAVATTSHAQADPIEAHEASPQGHAHTHNHAPTAAPQPTTSASAKQAKALSATLQGKSSRKISVATFDTLKTGTVGDTVQLDIAGTLIHGTIAAVQRKDIFHKIGIRLDDEAGTALVNITDGTQLKAQISLTGQTSVFTLNGDIEHDSATFEKKAVSDVYCAPKGATLTQALGLESINAPVYTPSVPAPEDGEIPILNSKPGSEYVIYLDLDGETVTDPNWTDRNFFNTIYATPMANSTNASWVTAVFRRVCEDYVIFDVNVTTDYDVFIAADVKKRVQCVFTSTNFEGAGTGGIAYVDSFGTDVVCWVFWEDEYFSAYAASHEVGHTLGLSHDGDSNSSYYGGHGDGETSWAPLMGNGFYDVSDPFERPNVTQWSNGDYDDADNQEDDLAIITTTTPRTNNSTEKNGLNYRADDYGDRTILSETLNVPNGAISHYGIVEQTDDQDWFKFLTEGGSIQIDADVVNIMSTEGTDGSNTYGSNLAVELTLYDSTGTQIDQSSPDDILGASLTTNLPSELALYYISIDGAGRKTSSDGFSDYGSLGEYLVSGNITPANITISDNNGQLIGPDAVASPTNGTAFGFVNESTTHQFQITNTGSTPISTTSITSNTNNFTASSFAPATLAPGESQSFNITFDTSSYGLYYGIITVNYDDGTPQTYPISVSATRTSIGGDDNYERNDTFFEPYNLSSTPGTNLQFLLGYGYQRNNDWFQIAIPAGSNQIKAQCDFLNSEGNIDLLLYDQTGRLLQTESSTDDNETLEYLVSHSNGGTFYLLVKSADSNDAETNNIYDLTWDYETVVIIPPAAEDPYEENDDFNNAKNMTTEPSLSGWWGLGTQLDNDWFKFTTPGNDNRLDISCTFDNDAGNIDIILYDDRGYPIISSTGSNDVEQIIIPISTPGSVYYVLVKSGEETATGNTYDLEWSTSYTNSIDDFYEENDTRETATSAISTPDTPISETPTGKGIQYDDDWFVFSPENGTIVMLIYVDFPDAVGNIQIAAYDYRGILTSTGTATADGAFVNIEVHGGSTFYLEVTGSNIGDTYDLYYENLTEDKYEPNNSAASATDLTEYNRIPLSRIEGSGIQNENDWYKYTVPEGSYALTVEANFIHAEGDLDMALTTPDGTVYVSAGVVDEEYIFIFPDTLEETIEGGDYFLRLYGWAGNHNSAYDLSFTVLEPPALPDPAPEDNYESNNTFEDPSTALSSASQRGVLLSNVNGFGTQLNADWYRISVPSGQNMVTVQCDFIHYADGNIDMAIYTGNGNPVATATSSSSNETITFLAAASGGTYLIQITGENAGVNYDLSWTSTSPPAEDAYEPNSFVKPTNINSLEGQWLSTRSGNAIQYNADWYTFSTTGKNLLIIDCQFSHSDDNDLRMVLYRNGYEVDSIDSDSGLETLFYFDDDGGDATYKLLIDGPGNGTSYDLYWNAYSLNTTTPVEDNYEDNDDYFEARSLSSHEGTWLSAINGYGVKIDDDNDWYRIDIPAGKSLVTINTAYVNYDYIVYLRDKDGRILYNWDGGSTGQVTPNSDGDTFYLNITTYFNGAKYDIRWNATTASITALDADSDNLSDAWEQANGLSIESINTDENLDADRYPNWAEYTLNLDPNVFSSNIVRQFQDEDYIYIQFTQRQDAIADGYSVTVKESATLSFSSHEAVHVSTVPSPDSDQLQIVTYRCSNKLSDTPACFFMLEVNKPE